jgi:hypothetical protein
LCSGNAKKGSSFLITCFLFHYSDKSQSKKNLLRHLVFGENTCRPKLNSRIEREWTSGSPVVVVAVALLLARGGGDVV